MVRPVPGRAPGAGSTGQGSETDLGWALGWLPDRMREIDEDLATTELEEDSGMSPGAAEMQQKNVTQPVRSRGDRRGHFI